MGKETGEKTVPSTRSWEGTSAENSIWIQGIFPIHEKAQNRTTTPLIMLSSAITELGARASKSDKKFRRYRIVDEMNSMTRRITSLEIYKERRPLAKYSMGVERLSKRVFCKSLLVSNAICSSAQRLLVIALLATVFWNTVFFYARHSDTPLLLPLQTSDQLVSSPLPVASLLPEDTRKPSLPIIAIIGRTGAGKSTFIKTLDGLSIGTKEFTFYKFNYASEYGTAALIIETPGLLDANLSDTDIMRGIRTTLDENRLDNRNIHMIYPYYLTLPKFNDEAHKVYSQELIGLDITGRIALATTRQCLSDPVNIAVARCLRIGDFAEVAAWTVTINIRDAPPEASSSQSSYKIKASA
ncbi:uncharacterized protein RAG0_02404 [Rhynchosporium agropyri]|uniref:G domain-containing protein n=1 Tax=Rhynchosporium agropyri TaxID=914238 RepID=A0A1E1K145_9HELO|nr:uncharacterized protein RAG0_02404 [Rhynchosporium agropyri]